MDDDLMGMARGAGAPSAVDDGPDTRLESVPEPKTEPVRNEPYLAGTESARKPGLAPEPGPAPVHGREPEHGPEAGSDPNLGPGPDGSPSAATSPTSAAAEPVTAAGDPDGADADPEAGRSPMADIRMGFVLIVLALLLANASLRGVLGGRIGYLPESVHRVMNPGVQFALIVGGVIAALAMLAIGVGRTVRGYAADSRERNENAGPSPELPVAAPASGASAAAAQVAAGTSATNGTADTDGTTGVDGDAMERAEEYVRWSRRARVEWATGPASAVVAAVACLLAAGYLKGVWYDSYGFSGDTIPMLGDMPLQNPMTSVTLLVTVAAAALIIYARAARVRLERAGTVKPRDRGRSVATGLAGTVMLLVAFFTAYPCIWNYAKVTQVAGASGEGATAFIITPGIVEPGTRMFGENGRDSRTSYITVRRPGKTGALIVDLYDTSPGYDPVKAGRADIRWDGEVLVARIKAEPAAGGSGADDRYIVQYSYDYRRGLKRYDGCRECGPEWDPIKPDASFVR